MSNSKLFLSVLLLAATFGFWYWGRQSAKPQTGEKPAPNPEIIQRSNAEPFPAENRK